MTTSWYASLVDLEDVTKGYHIKRWWRGEVELETDALGEPKIYDTLCQANEIATQFNEE